MTPLNPWVVCLHGFMGQPESWHPTLDIVESEIPGLRTYCPSLAGHGMESSLAEGTAFVDEVDRLAQGAVAAGAQEAHLAGYSMGGRLALGLLVRHGRLFRSATLIGVHTGFQDEALRQQRAEQDEARVVRLEQDGLDAFLADWERLPLFASQEVLPKAVLDRQREQRRGHSAAGLATALRRLGPANMPDYLPSLSSVDVPVTLMVGERDTKFLRVAKVMLDVLPDGNLEVVSGAGHNLLLEASGRVAECVLRRV